ncbi:MBG domain-containing protein [Algoriphagus aquaeductus]|nr:MBG domain-containing protein [Algoriphagus aquaeductus]
MTIGLSGMISQESWGQVVQPTVTTDKLDYAPGEVAIISGSGWIGDSKIDIHMDEDPPLHADHQHDFTDVPVNADGTWSVQFPIEEYHLGVTFYVTVTGQETGRTAEWVFTDGNVTFNSVGLPGLSGASVDYRYRNPTGANNSSNDIIGTDSTSFTVGARNNELVFFSYPDLISIGGINYSLISVGISSGTLAEGTLGYDYQFSSPNATRTLTGNYGALVISPVTTTYGSASVELKSTLYSNYQTSVGISGQTITFFINGTSVGTGTTNASGIATLNVDITSLPSPLGKLDAGGSYTITSSFAGVTGTYLPISAANSTSSTLTVNKRPVTVTAEDKSKIYGNADPAFTYQITSGSLAFTDSFTGALTRDSGEDVGDYAITQGTLALSSNYDLTFVAGNLEITERPIEVTADDKSKIYGNADPAFTYQITSGSLAFTDSFTGALTRDSGEDVGDYAITQGTLALSGNYILTFVAGNLEITPLPVTVTADAISKFCGQVNPPLTYTSSPAVGTALPNGALIGFTGSLTRVPGEGVGSYAIQQGSLANSNYVITYVGANFTINGVTIDASASSTPVPMGSAAMLSATVTPNVADVTVTFTVTNEANTVVFTTTASTNSSGVATATTGSLNAIGVLKVTATAGSGCAESVAYIPVFDASGSFVTGGGWIESPAGAMPANPNAVGKANFGFVSRYKKGSTQVDGNTEFQFNAGGINFKSTMHESGSLVISGRKATYRGSGTINGQTGFKFVVVAIDGDWNGQNNPDAFRIKITTTSGVTIYDNKIGSAENADDATILGNNGTGGGSIVIHEVKAPAKGNKRVSTELMTVAWNTPVETIKKQVDQLSLTWFESRKLPMTLDASNYDPLTPGFYELKVDLMENEFFALDEPISIQVLVQDKPKALDILVDNSKLTKELRVGDVLGILRTIDPVDNIHTYGIGDHPDLTLDGDKLIWKGTTVPAQLKLTVFSTDRAGQTISREISLSREMKPGEFFLYPNPAQRETNVMVDLDQEATVAIRIYDAVGRMVVENEAYREGSFTQTFNLDGLAAGFYTVQVKVGDMVMTKRLIKK